MTNANDDRGPVSEGTGDLPAGWGWRTEEGIPGCMFLWAPGVAGQDLQSATAHTTGGWRAYQTPDAPSSFAQGDATQRPGETLLAAAQREATSALWACDGFGVGEVRGVLVTGDPAGGGVLRGGRVTYALPGLPSRWAITAERVVPGGIEVDAVRVDARPAGDVGPLSLVSPEVARIHRAMGSTPIVDPDEVFGRKLRVYPHDPMIVPVATPESEGTGASDVCACGASMSHWLDRSTVRAMCHAPRSVEPAHIEGETLGEWRARHGLPGTNTGAALSIVFRDGLWRNADGRPATSAAELARHRHKTIIRPAAYLAQARAAMADKGPGHINSDDLYVVSDVREIGDDKIEIDVHPFVAPTFEDRERNELARLSPALPGAIAFAREAFRNDGAEGETVWLLARAAELLTRERERLVVDRVNLARSLVAVQSARDEAVHFAEQERDALRARVADLERVAEVRESQCAFQRERADDADRHAEKAIKDGNDARSGWAKAGKDLEVARARAAELLLAERDRLAREVAAAEERADAWANRAAEGIATIKALRARVAELEALVAAPPVGSVAGLLAKIEAKETEARDSGSNYPKGDPDGDTFDAVADAFDEAARLIRSTLAPTPLDAVVAEVVALSPEDDSIYSPSAPNDAYREIRYLCESDPETDEGEELASARRDLLRIARVAIAGALACDAAKGDA